MSVVKLDYQGFHPSVFTQKYLNFVLNKIVEEAPRKAILHGHFTRHGESFKGFVQILSHGGEFFATAEGERLKEVLKRITLQLRKKMGRQKQRRINHDKVSQHLSPEASDANEPTELVYDQTNS